MSEIFNLPLNVTLFNEGNKTSFIPYRENSKFFLGKGDSIKFNASTSEEAVYYSAQANGGIKFVGGDESIVVTSGEYNSTTGTFTSGTSYNSVITYRMASDETGVTNEVGYSIIGKVKYLPADATLGLSAGNRFVALIKNSSITAKADLPSGNIVTVSVVGGTTNKYTKDAFESDGSLIVALNINKYSVANITIKWSADLTEKYVVVFDKADFLAENEIAENVKNTIIKTPVTITITNNNSKNSVGYIPYKENFEEYIDKSSSIVFTADTPEQVMYYINQGNSDLTITYVNANN